MCDMCGCDSQDFMGVPMKRPEDMTLMMGQVDMNVVNENNKESM
jgi:hypothetical protein